MIQCRMRFAEERDLTFLTNLYNYYIEHTAVTFDTVPFSVEQRREWLNQHPPESRHKVCIAEDSQGIPLGFTASHPFRLKPAYETSVEISIYIKPGLERQGIGKQLYAHLFTLLQREDIHRAYACIAVPNPSSIALHSFFDFTPVGLFTEAGRKFGSYISIQWMEKHFD